MRKVKVQNLNSARIYPQREWCQKVSKDFDRDQIHDMYYEILDIMCESLGVNYNESLSMISDLAQDLIEEMNLRGFNYVQAALNPSADTLSVVVYEKPVGFDTRKPAVPENFDTESERHWKEKFWIPVESFIESKGFEILKVQEIPYEGGSTKLEFKLADGPEDIQLYKKMARYLDYLSENDLIPGAYYSGSFYDRMSMFE